MNITNHIKSLYGKENLFAHIYIFSILGVMAIFSSNIADLYFDVVYFGFPPVGNAELLFNIMVSLFIFILFKGYVYDYAGALFEDDDAKLPDIKIKSFVTFFKIFPLCVAWLTYFIIMLIVGMISFKIINIWSDIYYTFVWGLIPFISMIFVMYSKNFNLGTSIFNPLPLFAVIKKSFGLILLFLLKTVPFIFLIAYLFFRCFIFTKYLANYPFAQLGIRLFLLSLSVYFCGVVSLIYVRGFVEIAKEKELI